MNTYPPVWPCGTVKSQGNAFSWERPSDKEAYQKLLHRRQIGMNSYYRRKERDLNTVKEQMKRAATRVNRNVDLGSHGGTANALKGR